MDRVLKELKLEFRGEVLSVIGSAKSMDAQSIDILDGKGDAGYKGASESEVGQRVAEKEPGWRMTSCPEWSLDQTKVL